MRFERAIVGTIVCEHSRIPGFLRESVLGPGSEVFVVLRRLVHIGRYCFRTAAFEPDGDHFRKGAFGMDGKAFQKVLGVLLVFGLVVFGALGWI